jgi:hypothetical protein
MRLDAVPFTGVEPVDRADATTMHYQHVLSILRTNEMAFLTRRLGGWTFHELNVPLRQLRKYTEHGSDLSYDFFTRAQVLHALVDGDAGPLRLAYRQLQEAGVEPIGLVHDLQNHDEITYQLVELNERQKEVFSVNGRQVTGKELREQMLEQMRTKLAGEAVPYTMLYRSEKDGLATTCSWPRRMPCSQACSACRAGTWSGRCRCRRKACASGPATAIIAGSIAVVSTSWGRTRTPTAP